MLLLERRSELKEMIRTAACRVVSTLEESFDGNRLYAFVFLPSGGYRTIEVALGSRNQESKRTDGDSGVGLSAGTLEMLKSHPDLYQRAISSKTTNDYYLVNACEWDTAGDFIQIFDHVNSIIDADYDRLYDEGFDNHDICNSFESILTETIIDLKQAGIFKRALFEDDVLLGVQFADTDSAESVLRISENVNSEYWHRKVCDSYGR